MAEVHSGVEPFLRAGAKATRDANSLVVAEWQRTDWETLFSYAELVKLARGDTLIHRNAAERTLYFVDAGALEVTTLTGGVSPEAIDWFLPGSVVGELSFFDGKPRSAEVSATQDSELYRLDFPAYQRFADAHPRMACDFVFAIGRLVALRLRQTMSKVEQSL